MIAFHVAYSHAMFSGTTIPFNVIKTNLGNCWSSSNHRFTASVKGLYFFTLNIRTPITASQNHAQAYIMRGNVRLRFVYANRYPNIKASIPASGSAVVMLNAGEHVWAKRNSGYLYSDRYLYTHLVGFLIQKLN